MSASFPTLLDERSCFKVYSTCTRFSGGPCFSSAKLISYFLADILPKVGSHWPVTLEIMLSEQKLVDIALFS